ncbi:hypothetical protein OIO90_006250 [Microbotryomycetes sp. JL221]|nr:hypothetical protein OIO90_006250 [Microbotryomycetes sp. JL221]
MVSLVPQEDRPTPSSVYNWRLYCCAFVAASAAILIGYDSAFIGSTMALPSFKAEFRLTDQFYSAEALRNINANIVSCYQAGAILGALLVYPAGQLLGRKWGMLVTAIIFELGAGIMLAAKGSVGLGPIYAGRVIAGLGVGAASNLAPLYISEVAPPSIRGMLIGAYELGWQIGGLVGFWLPYGVNQNLSGHVQWITPFAVQLIPGGLFLLGIPFFIKESPRWLISRGRREEAIQNLCYLRKLNSDDNYMIEELNQIDTQVEQDQAVVGTSFWGPFRLVFSNWHLLRRMLIVTSLFMFQNGTGINAINYYSPRIFASLGITGTSTALLTTGVFGVIKTVGALVWIFFVIDRWGRVNILLLGAAGGAVSMFAIAAYIKIENPAANPTSDLTAGGKASLFFFYLWTIFYAVSWNGTPWVVCAESFGSSVRQVTQMFAAMSNWVFNLAIARATPQMFAEMGAGGYGVYLFFASMMIVSIPYIIFFLPEGKGVPLESMDVLWSQKNVWRANKIVMEGLRREHDATGNPQLLHQEKNTGSTEQVERASSDIKV